jgi:hypothetical protein
LAGFTVMNVATGKAAAVTIRIASNPVP